MPRLGTLEAAVMDVLWSAEDPLRVREALEEMPGKGNLAYTTVLTLLGNLHRKGMVDRAAAGRAYSYGPALNRQETAAASLREVLDAFEDPRSVLLHFAETASEEESTVLRDGLARRQQQS